MKSSGFKGNGDNESVLFVFNGTVSVDPYSRDDQATFAKWYVGRMQIKLLSV